MNIEKTEDCSEILTVSINYTILLSNNVSASTYHMPTLGIYKPTRSPRSPVSTKGTHTMIIVIIIITNVIIIIVITIQKVTIKSMLRNT